MSTALSSRLSQGLRPGRDLFRSLREEMDDVLGRFAAEVTGDLPAGALAPAVDLSETDTTITVRMDLPGVKPDDVKIDLTGDVLRITAERKEQKEEKGRTFHRLERRAGRFYRAVTLPCAVEDGMGDPEYAEYANGVLTIVLPKSEAAKSRQIKVKAK